MTNTKALLIVLSALTLFVILPIILFLCLPNNVGELSLIENPQGFTRSPQVLIRGTDTSDLFSTPQILTNPGTSPGEFGQFLFSHDKGFFCTTLQTSSGSTKLFFYETVANKGIQLSSTDNIEINERNDEDEGQGSLEFQPVCSGAFLPVMGVVNEVYYLAISVGVTDIENHPNMVFAQRIIFFYYDTNPDTDNSMRWTRTTNVNNTADNHLSHPYRDKVLQSRSSAEPTAYRPWIGSFGNTMQGFVTNAEAQNNNWRSLYIWSTEFDNETPGGSIFQFIFENNTSTTPSFIPFPVNIGDAKLTDNLSVVGIEKTLPSDLKSYMRGFGRAFNFQSNGLPGGAVNLAVGNPVENQDLLTRTCNTTSNNSSSSPGGYVQMYRNFDNGGWKQTAWSCGPGQVGTSYYGRYTTDFPIPFPEIDILPPFPTDLNPTNFGFSVLISDNTLLVATNSKNNTTQHVIAYPLTPPKTSETKIPGEPNPSIGYDQIIKAYPGGKPKSVLNLSPDLDTDSIFFENEFLYNRPMFVVNGYLCVVSLSKDIGKFNVGIYDASTRNDDPDNDAVTLITFATWNEPLQKFGGTDNSGTSNERSRFGFAQFATTWKSENGLNVYLGLNDPMFNDVTSGAGRTGRIIIYRATKNKA